MAVEHLLGAGAYGMTWKTQHAALKATSDAAEALAFDVIYRARNDAELTLLDPGYPAPGVVTVYRPPMPFDVDGMPWWAIVRENVTPLHRSTVQAVRVDRSGRPPPPDDDDVDAGRFQTHALWATQLAHECAAARSPTTRRKAFGEYLSHLQRAAREAGTLMRPPLQTALDLATNPSWRAYGGPWVVGDVRPMNVGVDRDARGVCFDLQFLAPAPEAR